MISSGSNHFAHFSQDIPDNVKTPIVIPDVGIIILLKPSPNWKARTAVCLVTPTISASGIIIGIVRAALALPDGTKKFIIE